MHTKHISIARISLSFMQIWDNILGWSLCKSRNIGGIQKVKFWHHVFRCADWFTESFLCNIHCIYVISWILWDCRPNCGLGKELPKESSIILISVDLPVKLKKRSTNDKMHKTHIEVCSHWVLESVSQGFWKYWMIVNIVAVFLHTISTQSFLPWSNVICLEKARNQ